MSLALLIVDPWQYCVCCIRSGATWCTLLMVLYLDRMFQCGLHAVIWSHIGALMRLLAVEPRSTARFLFLYQSPSGTILLTQFSMVWDWRVSREGPMFFLLAQAALSLLYNFFLSLLSVHRLVLWGWGLRSDRVYINLSQPYTA